MFESFTDRARRLLVNAEQYAADRQQGYIGTEHLLLSMVADREGVAATVLHDLGASEAAITGVLEHLSPRGDEALSERLPFARELKQALKGSLEEAVKLGHNYIATEHLLLGLVRHESVGGKALAELGVAQADVRSAVLRRLREMGLLGGADAANVGQLPHERLLREARLKAGKANQVGVLELLREMVRTEIDSQPREVLEVLGMDEDFFDASIEIFQDALDEPSESAAAVVERAKDLWDREDPSLLQLMHAAMMPPAPVLRRALGMRGVRPSDVAMDAASADAEREGAEQPQAGVLAFTTLNLVLSLVVTVLIVRSAASSGWWKLLLVMPIWSGYPGYGPLVGVMLAGALGLVVSPLSAVLHVVSVGGEIAQAGAELEEALPLSGARLSVRRWRHHVQRRYVRRGERGAGIARMHLVRRAAWQNVAESIRFRRAQRDIEAYWGLPVRDLSEAATVVASRARQHARRTGDDVATGGHVLLAIAQTDRRCSELLAEVGVTRPALASLFPDAGREANPGQPKFGLGVNAALRSAQGLTKGRRAAVSCAALLLALLDDPDARHLLDRAGVDPEVVRAALGN